MDGIGAQNDENDQLFYFKSNKGYDKLMNNRFLCTQRMAQW